MKIKYVLCKSIPMFAIIMAIMVTGISAETSDNITSKQEFSLDNETIDLKSTSQPVKRLYSLDNKSWQEETIEFKNIDNSNITLYIKTINKVDKHFDMNIYHYFREGSDFFRSHGDFSCLNYGLYVNGSWIDESMFTGEWARVESNRTTSMRYKSHRFVNDIEPLTTRYERVEMQFWPNVEYSSYQYNSKIYIVNNIS